MPGNFSPRGFRTDPLTMARFLMHLPNFIKLYWRLLTDRRVPLLPKVILVAGIAYLIMPLDALFDFVLPPLGLLDDAVVLMLAARGFMALCPRRIVAEHVRLIDEGG